ncbi:hypothetical protein C9374_014449 [Naegleria lovaniensis]|uniref:Peptidase S8/S53 domain-containing protein n=1 Tax=Naegleria lovaniensis TaxID=51637 RepID=A0AA88KPF5_NAELO|nr:uncharacterized protein C9374_014449 [Naegleria lovaniensis]KAG2389049.1 hypothetical protein C9374_014449 [Naegleria lovaniensis]
MPRKGFCHHLARPTAEMTRLLQVMMPLFLASALIFIIATMISTTPTLAQAVLKGEQNLLNLLNSESSSRRDFSAHHRRRISLEDLNLLNNKRSLMREDGSSVLNFFEQNPFISETNAWIHEFQSSSPNKRSTTTTASDNDIHVLVTFKTNQDSRQYEKILSTPMGENTFTSRVNVQQLKRLIEDENVKVVEHFDPMFKFVESQFTPENTWAKNIQRFFVDPNAKFRHADTNFKLSAEPFIRRPSENWQFSYTDRNGEEFVVLRILTEERSALNGYLQNLKEFSRGSIQFLNNVGNRFMMSVKKSDALAVTYEISKRSEVFWVELAPKNELHNYWARGITQSGLPESQPVTYRGLTGKNQIVTVGDSGLDGNSCFFHDSDHEVPYVNTTSSLSVSSHRKIASYWGLMDTISEDNAHGTHVAGTIVSQSTTDALSQHNGIAPDAKVAFTDIGCSDPKGCSCHGVEKGCYCDGRYDKKCPASDRAVYPPNSLSEDYFPFAYKLGSRIHTNSWGGGAGILGYSIDTADIDKYVWEHKDMLILFSAGNSGDAMGYSSISTQAEAKNILSVGASMNPLATFQYVTDKLLDMNAYAQNYAKQLLSILDCPAENQNSSSTCSGFNSDFLETCQFLRNFKTEADCCNTTGKYCSNSGCGCAFYGLGSLCCRKCRSDRMKTSYSNTVYNKENIAYFSSRGPTSDGRIKPDIVAPGYFIVSARSHNTLSTPMTCSESSQDVSQAVLQMGGTSMSCPLTAANAALVRQYYTEGWYYDGKNNTSKGFKPSAALMKATIINSGVPLLGYLDLSGFLLPINDASSNPEFRLQAKYIEGFGRIQLDRVLMFDNSTRKLLIGRKENIKTSSSVKDEFGDPVISSEEESHTYCIAPKVSGTMNDVKITLTWTDYPSNPARGRHLVNNIDLGCKIDRDVYFGNSNTSNTFDRDNVNNVEQLVFNNVQSRIVVNIAASYIYKAQSYALVVSGENIKFDECGESDYFEYSARGKSSSNGLATGIKIFGFDLALVMLAVVLLLVIIAAASVTTCVFAVIWVRKKNSQTSFARLEDENNRL